VPELDPGDLLLIEAVLGDELALVELFRVTIDDLAARVASIESHAAVSKWIEAADRLQKPSARRLEAARDAGSDPHPSRRSEPPAGFSRHLTGRLSTMTAASRISNL
jgi:hypothetical protein